MFDAERVFADDQARHLFHGRGFAALANAHQAAFGFDGDDVGGLIKRGLVDVGPARRIGGRLVIAHPLDAVARQAQREGIRWNPGGGHRGGGHARHQRAAIHRHPFPHAGLRPCFLYIGRRHSTDDRRPLQAVASVTIARALR